jgi:DNA-binding Lrp family transcriptional regulator
MSKNRRSLDNTDLDILSSLYKDARLSNKELASQVNLAASSCLERVKRLQTEGVIERSSLQVDYTALDGHIQAIVSVSLTNHVRATFDTFQSELLPLPEVISIFHMGGESDFLLHVTVTDTAHLRDFVFNAVTARSDVKHVETALVYEHQISRTLPRFD